LEQVRNYTKVHKIGIHIALRKLIEFGLRKSTVFEILSESQSLDSPPQGIRSNFPQLQDKSQDLKVAQSAHLGDSNDWLSNIDLGNIISSKE
jgi:hypothetical protein